MRCAVSMSVAVLVGSLALVAQVKDFRPVTEAMLRNPDAGDWLNWRRTDNAWGYSPLDQINRQNVQQLQLAWSWAMDDTGAKEATPLVHDGVMYLPNPRGVIQALDAATGDLIWEYRPEAPTPTPAAAAQRGGSTAGGGEQTDIPALSQARPGARWAATTVDGDSTKHRHLRRQDLRHHQRRAHRRPGRADREARVGHQGRRHQDGLRIHVGPDRRSRQSDRGDHRVQPLQRGRLLHHRT